MSLSDKIFDGEHCPDSSMAWLDTDDVKEFIQKIKKFVNVVRNDYYDYRDMLKKIDEEAGEALA